jgi:DNA repair exonuclease SbcCD ATPase subunit
MKLLNLKMKNFLSFADAEVNLNDRGLVLVEGENRDAGGSNGAGKSALFDAILFCLYGVTARGLRADSVITNGRSYSSVRLEFVHEGDTISIKRARGEDANLQLWINSVEKGKGRDTQKLINEIVRLDYYMFTTIGMFTQGMRGYGSATDAIQKDILGKILDFSKFQAGEERAKRVSKSLTDNIRATMESIAAFEQRIKDSQVREEELKREQGHWEDTQRLKLKLLREQLERLQPPEGLEDLKKQEKDHVQRIQEFNPEGLRDLIDRGEGKLRALERDRATLEARADNLEDQLRDPIQVDQLLATESVCPTCGQRISSEAAIRNRKEALERDNEEIRRNNVLIQSKLEQLQTDLLLTSNKIEDILKKIGEVKSAIREADRLSCNLDGLRHQIRDLTYQLESFHERKQNLTTAIAETENNSWPGRNYLYQEQARQASLIASRDEQRRELQELKAEYPYVEFWVKGFGKKGIQSFLIDSSIPYLNERANAYISALSNGYGSIEFRTTKDLASGGSSETFQIVTSYAYGGNTGTSCISGGEETRSDLSIFFARGDLASLRASVVLAFRFLDEPFESLDRQGCEQVVKVLRQEVVPHIGTIFVTTHQDDLKMHFDRRLLITKENGVSRIREE